MDTYSDKDGTKIIHHKFGGGDTPTSRELRMKYGNPNSTGDAPISSLSMREIADHLASRVGVEMLIILPYEEYEVNTARREIQEQGAARILVIKE